MKWKRHIKIELCFKLSLLWLFHVGHVVQNRRSALSLSWHEWFSCKGNWRMKDLRLLARVVVRTSDMKISRRRLPDRLRQNIAPQSVTHLLHEYFSSFNQSNHWLWLLQNVQKWKTHVQSVQIKLVCTCFDVAVAFVVRVALISSLCCVRREQARKLCFMKRVTKDWNTAIKDSKKSFHIDVWPSSKQSLSLIFFSDPLKKGEVQYVEIETSASCFYSFTKTFRNLSRTKWV